MTGERTTSGTVSGSAPVAASRSIWARRTRSSAVRTRASDRRALQVGELGRLVGRAAGGGGDAGFGAGAVEPRLGVAQLLRQTIEPRRRRGVGTGGRRRGRRQVGERQQRLGRGVGQPGASGGRRRRWR